MDAQGTEVVRRLLRIEERIDSLERRGAGDPAAEVARRLSRIEERFDSLERRGTGGAPVLSPELLAAAATAQRAFASRPLSFAGTAFPAIATPRAHTEPLASPSSAASIAPAEGEPPTESPLPSAPLATPPSSPAPARARVLDGLLADPFVGTRAAADAGAREPASETAAAPSPPPEKSASAPERSPAGVSAAPTAGIPSTSIASSALSAAASSRTPLTPPPGGTPSAQAAPSPERVLVDPEYVPLAPRPDPTAGMSSRKRIGLPPGRSPPTKGTGSGDDMPAPSPRRDLERFVGVSVLGRVGVAALLLAAGYFAQWTYARIPPVGRVAAVYGLSALLLAIGAWRRERVSRVYLGILWGGAVSAAYMAGYTAQAVYGLVDSLVATVLLAGACALGQVLARWTRMQALAVLAIAGAAAAPVLVGGPEDARTALLVYLAVVHGWSAFVERRWGWKAVRLVGLSSTIAVAGMWLARFGRLDVSTLAHVLGYLVAWTAPEWTRTRVERLGAADRAVVAAVVVAIAAAALVPARYVLDTDLRTPLVGYLLAVYALSVAVAARYRQSFVLVVGLVTTGITAGVWLSMHGRVDMSTYVHVHVLLVGWTAPAWVRALRRRAVDPEVARVSSIVLGVVEGVALVCTWEVADDTLRRGFGVAAAALWGAIAVLVRVSTREAGPFVRSFARIAGLLLVLGAVTALDGLHSGERGALLAVAAAGALVFGARRFLGTGEGATCVGAVVALLLAPGLPRDAVDPASAAALVLPALLFLRSSGQGWRSGAIVLLAAAPFATLWPFEREPAGWLVAAFAASLVLLTVAHARSARRGDLACEIVAGVMAGVLAFGWAAEALLGRFVSIPRPVANEGTAVAIALVGALVAMRASKLRDGQESSMRPLLGALAVAVLLGATWREAHDVAAAMPLDLGHVVDSATLALFGTALALAGRGRGAAGRAVSAFVVLALGACYVLGTIERPGSALTAGAQVLLVAGPAVLVASLASTKAVGGRKVGALLLLAAVAAWGTAFAVGRWGADLAPVANARFASGALLVSALVVVRLRPVPLRRFDAAPVLGLAAAVLSFAVMLPEVLAVVAPVESSAWRQAIVSVYASVHCAAVLAIGFRTKNALTRWLALAGFAVVVAKIAFADLATVETPLRVLVTGAIGAVLLAAAYAYARLARASGDVPPANRLHTVP